MTAFIAAFIVVGDTAGYSGCFTLYFPLRAVAGMVSARGATNNERGFVADILRYGDYTVTPWKNGQGVTREIMKQASGNDGEFLWRLSLAEVGQSGPFSAFEGYDRTIILLGGDGFNLNFDDGTVAKLDTPHEPYDFDGGAPLQCDLLGRMSQDLNLMVHRDLMEAQWQVADLDAGESLALEAAPGVTQLVFCLMGGARIEMTGDQVATLGAWDCALFDDTESTLITVAPDSKPRIFHAAMWAR